MAKFRLGVFVFFVFAAQSAHAQVLLTFHSFNGSVMGGRYPHTFISLKGTLEETGQTINENYGYTAARVSPAILSRNVDGLVVSEEEKYVRSTNRHFTIKLSDAQYREIVAEVSRWRNAPGADYSLSSNNCIHFVARIARLVGLQADVPAKMTRRPKLWLNYVTRMNPSLGALQIR